MVIIFLFLYTLVWGAGKSILSEWAWEKMWCNGMKGC